MKQEDILRYIAAARVPVKKGDTVFLNIPGHYIRTEVIAGKSDTIAVSINGAITLVPGSRFLRVENLDT